MNRQILLVEPNYSNKYPPMGLMKISTYYKNLGDHVRFFKGDLKDLVLDDIYEMLLPQLYANREDIFWEYYKPQIIAYIRKGTTASLEEIPESDDPIIKDLFRYYRKFFRDKMYFDPRFRKYDRVGITTLFTFYWDITIDTINFAKQLCKTQAGVMVGGVMATILADRVEAATGIRPKVGTLDTPGELDPDNDMIIDTLPLDYSILEEIDYEYPESDGYYAYMTRGCVNRCAFCAVPKLEPTYKQFLPLAKQVKEDEQKYGAKRNLLLLDNNVLASKRFNEIIDNIKDAGFYTGATYIAPNKYEIAIQNLKIGQNDRGYVKSCVKLFRQLLSKYKNDPNIQEIYDTLKDNFLLEEYTADKDIILETYETFKPWFEKMYSRKPRQRFVDFNQGIDSRLITDENMKKLAEIPIRPVRIAFDHWELRDKYETAVRTAVRHGHNNLSNYILYNFNDKPIELYYRLKLNVDLCEELNVSIYSFPMKYHPIEDPVFFSNRDYIGKEQNRKFIRTIQAVLNSTKGKVGKGKEFFNKAFGANEEEFFKLLYMPEAMIIYRLFFEETGIVDQWWNDFCSLTEQQKSIAKPIIERNIFTNFEETVDDAAVQHVLEYYRITREVAEEMMKKNSSS